MRILLNCCPIRRVVLLSVALPFFLRPVALAQPPFPDHPRRAAQFEALRQRDQNGFIAPNGLAKAIQQGQQMKYDANAWPGAAVPKGAGPQPKIADLNTNNWQWLGPGNVGGRLRSILINPASPSTMWVGSVGGGVWKTTNGAASFFPCDDWMANLAVGCLVLDPTDPNTLYAGTGEGFNNNDAIQGNGIFKSADGGTTWTQLTTYAVQNNINRLAVCPTNHLIVLAATGNGVWRSTDGGANWTMTYTNPTTQVAFNPANGGAAIATGYGVAVYSTDGGQTWTSANGLAAAGRIEFAYAPSSPNLVYASQDNNQGSIFQSTDGGVNYTLQNTGSNYLGSQGWYANCIWVDPTNPNNVVVGGLNLWRSTDGGATLTQISDWTLGPGTINNGNSTSPLSAHADHHAIVSSPLFDGVNNTTVFFGNDGGLACATNVYTVTTSTGWTILNNNLGISQCYGVAGNPASLVVVAGLQDNGSISGVPAAGTGGWNYWGGGDGGFVASDPTDPHYFYGEYVNLQIYRSTNGAVGSTYINGGLGDSGIPPGYNEDDPDAPSSANFIAPFILDPNNPNTLLGGGSNLWRSVNAKAATPTWSNIKNGIASGDFISAIAVAPGNPDIIWVGYIGGEVYATANGTATNPTWTEKDSGTPNLPQRFCTRIAIDPTNPNIVYATFGGFNADNVYRTTDGGATWNNIAAGLPAAPVYSIVIAPFNHNYLYVGTEVGVFGSANAGANWSAANEGPANVQVQELSWMRNYLLAGTHGRGTYRIALGPPTVVVSPTSLVSYVGGNATFSASAIGTAPLNLQWQYDGNNLVGATGAMLTITNAQATNSGLYRVIVSNGEGLATSSVAPLTVLVSPPYRTQTQNEGPVAYWRLNETSGATAFDSIGGFNGTDVGNLVLGVSGPTAPAWPGFESGNTAYQFDGATTSVSVPALNLNTNTITMAAWVNGIGTQAYRAGIFFNRDINGNGWGLRFDAANDLGFTWNGGQIYDSTLNVPPNQWTFVALVVTPTNGILYMATNSTLQAWTNNVANSAAAFDLPSSIGSDPGFTSRTFLGGIDEVAVFNRSLAFSEINGLLSASVAAQPAVTLTSPVDGSTLSASPNILLSATVVANGHAIGNVSFYDSANLLGQSATPPYQFTWTGATPGLHTLLAQVSYDGSSTISSLPATVTVTNSGTTTVIGQITSITQPAPGVVQLNFLGTPTHSYGIQRTTNLLSHFTTLWTTNAPAGGIFSFTDSFSDLGGNPPGAAFYRLSWMP